MTSLMVFLRNDDSQQITVLVRKQVVTFVSVVLHIFYFSIARL